MERRTGCPCLKTHGGVCREGWKVLAITAVRMLEKHEFGATSWPRDDDICPECDEDPHHPDCQYRAIIEQCGALWPQMTLPEGMD